MNKNGKRLRQKKEKEDVFKGMKFNKLMNKDLNKGTNIQTSK